MDEIEILPQYDSVDVIGGQLVAVVVVPFRLVNSGINSRVEVPASRYTSELALSMVQDKAARLYATHVTRLQVGS